VRAYKYSPVPTEYLPGRLAVAVTFTECTVPSHEAFLINNLQNPSEWIYRQKVWKSGRWVGQSFGQWIGGLVVRSVGRWVGRLVGG
jgi:hypothetical protein